MTWAIAISSPLLAFLGAFLGHRLASRADDRLDRWRRREETMRMLRWPVEMSLGTTEAERDTGQATVAALLDSELLQVEDSELVKRVARSIARTGLA